MAASQLTRRLVPVGGKVCNFPPPLLCNLHPPLTKGHQKAVGAVARHLAEATYWILTKGEPYREPKQHAVSSTKG